MNCLPIKNHIKLRSIVEYTFPKKKFLLSNLSLDDNRSSSSILMFTLINCRSSEILHHIDQCFAVKTKCVAHQMLQNAIAGRIFRFTYFWRTECHWTTNLFKFQRIGDRKMWNFSKTNSPARLMFAWVEHTRHRFCITNGTNRVHRWYRHMCQLTVVSATNRSSFER